MMKLHFKKVKKGSSITLEYDELFELLPLNIKFYKFNDLPETIRYDNYDGSNLIEFRFDKNILDFVELTVVAVDYESVKTLEIDNIIVVDDHFYRFFIDEVGLNKRSELRTQIYKGSSSICFVFGENKNIIYYKVSNNLYIGLDSNNLFKSFYLTELSSKNISHILGD